MGGYVAEERLPVDFQFLNDDLNSPVGPIKGGLRKGKAGPDAGDCTTAARPRQPVPTSDASEKLPETGGTLPAVNGH